MVFGGEAGLTCLARELRFIGTRDKRTSVTVVSSAGASSLAATIGSSTTGAEAGSSAGVTVSLASFTASLTVSLVSEGVLEVC